MTRRLRLRRWPKDLPLASRPRQVEAFGWVEQAIAARDELVELVRTGDLGLVDAFAKAQADPLAGRVFAVKVLEAIPGIGKVKARRTMARLGLDESITMAEVAPVAQFDLSVALSAE